MTDIRSAVDQAIARLPGDNGRYVVVFRDSEGDGLTGTVGIDTIHPLRFHMDRTDVARMIDALPYDPQAENRRLALEEDVLRIIERMAERLAVAAGVRWDKVSEPTGDEIVDRDTKGYWRLLARTSLGL